MKGTVSQWTLPENAEKTGLPKNRVIYEPGSAILQGRSDKHWSKLFAVFMRNIQHGGRFSNISFCLLHNMPGAVIMQHKGPVSFTWLPWWRRGCSVCPVPAQQRQPLLQLPHPQLPVVATTLIAAPQGRQQLHRGRCQWREVTPPTTWVNLDQLVINRLGERSNYCSRRTRGENWWILCVFYFYTDPLSNQPSHRTSQPHGAELRWTLHHHRWSWAALAASQEPQRRHVANLAGVKQHQTNEVMTLQEANCACFTWFAAPRDHIITRYEQRQSW